MKNGQLKEKIIYILKSHSEEPPDDISNDNFIFLPEYGKIADEILALTEEQKSKEDQYGKRLAAGRDFLMTQDPRYLTVEDCLEAFGFTRDGLNEIT